MTRRKVVSDLRVKAETRLVSMEMCSTVRTAEYTIPVYGSLPSSTVLDTSRRWLYEKRKKSSPNMDLVLYVNKSVLWIKEEDLFQAMRNEYDRYCVSTYSDAKESGLMEKDLKTIEEEFKLIGKELEDMFLKLKLSA